MTLFKEREIPESETDKLKLICEILQARIKMIRNALDTEQLKPSSVFTK